MIGVFGHAAPYCARLNKPTKLVYPKPCLKSIQTGGFSLQTPGGMRHLRAEKVRNAGICNNFEGPAPLLQNVPGMGETVGFSTQIHIRQFDIGENCKRCVVPHQKIVIFPTWKLQIVRTLRGNVEPDCGKLSGECSIPQGKQALQQDFWTFSTGFSTCGKNRVLLRNV